MPIYVYKCESCGHALDTLQKMSDPVLTDCPACGAPTLRKQVTAAGFQLKGTGWYVTDFRDGGKGKAAPATADKAGDKAGEKSGADKAAADKPAADKPVAATPSSGTGGSSAPATPAATSTDTKSGTPKTA